MKFIQVDSIHTAMKGTQPTCQSRFRRRFQIELAFRKADLVVRSSLPVPFSLLLYINNLPLGA